MRIYEFKFRSGETDWVFAPNIKVAREFYINHTGCGDLMDCTVKPVPKNEWSNQYLLDINESEPDPEDEDYNEDDYCCGYKIIESFAEYAARNTQTDIIATSEF